jgi:hypothetical protein
VNLLLPSSGQKRETSRVTSVKKNVSDRGLEQNPENKEKQEE